MDRNINYGNRCRADCSQKEEVMVIGTTKELKNHEYRVGLTPDNVSAYVAQGHKVLVEKSAGAGAGFLDEEYIAAGAVMKDTPLVFKE